MLMDMICSCALSPLLYYYVVHKKKKKNKNKNKKNHMKKALVRDT